MAQCQITGASVAGVALAHGITPTLLAAHYHLSISSGRCAWSIWVRCAHTSNLHVVPINALGLASLEGEPIPAFLEIGSEAQVPAHAQDHDLTLELPTLEQREVSSEACSRLKLPQSTEPPASRTCACTRALHEECFEVIEVEPKYETSGSSPHCGREFFPWKVRRIGREKAGRASEDDVGRRRFN